MTKFTKIIIFSLLALILCGKNSFASQTSWQEAYEKAAKVRLIGSFYKNEKGEEKLLAGLHFKILDGWKIYGPDAGSIGLPPSLDFKNSKNYSNHNIIWPKALQAKEEILDEIFEYSYYKHEVILPIEIDLKDYQELTKINLKVNYGICKDVCIPAEGEFLLEIPKTQDLKSLELIQKYYKNKILEEKSPKKPSKSLIYMILLAIIGGAILNIMPCVLPVLSIKLLSVINHLDSHISRIRFAFLSTIIGILFCFGILASIAALIKVGGSSFGWGFQFQNIYFLIFLIVILTIFSANLLGFFEIHFREFLSSIINKKISKLEDKKNIFIPNFLSGILAVMLATPCSAPFLGAAISFGLTQNLLTIFTIFFFIGIGFAMPYIILSFRPQIVYFLPKPGNWMLAVKKIMASFLILTILWLLWILSDNSGLKSALFIATLSILIFVAFKIKTKLLKFLILFLLILTSFLSTNFIKEDFANEVEFKNNWQKFDEKAIPQLVLEGKTVIVSITADWCITCKFNKIRVFKNKEVVEKLKNSNIIKMRGDITKPNEEIMNYLHKNNRFAIPFNAVYGPNDKNGSITSELLSKKELFELIDKAS